MGKEDIERIRWIVRTVDFFENRHGGTFEEVAKIKGDPQTSDDPIWRREGTEWRSLMKELSEQVDHQRSWEEGKLFGIRLGLARVLELRFDRMELEYIDKLYEIKSADLVEKLYELIYSNDSTRQDFESVLNLVDFCHAKQTTRQKSYEKGNEEDGILYSKAKSD